MMSKTVPIHDNVFDVLFDVIFYVILYHVFDDFFHVVFDMVFEVKFFNRAQAHLACSMIFFARRYRKQLIFQHPL